MRDTIQKHRFNTKKFGNQKYKNKMIIPLVKVCTKCKKRVVKFHHFVCDTCKAETIRKMNEMEVIKNGSI